MVIPLLSRLISPHVVHGRSVDVDALREPDPRRVALQLGLLGGRQQRRLAGGRLEQRGGEGEARFNFKSLSGNALNGVNSYGILYVCSMERRIFYKACFSPKFEAK